MALGFALVTYHADDGLRAGLGVGGDIYDAARSTGHWRDDSVLGILADWAAAKKRLSDAARSVAERASHHVGSPRLAAPIPRPGTIYCAGANYRDHVLEMAKALNQNLDPDPKSRGLRSWHFIKPSGAVVGPDVVVPLPPTSNAVDWEAELAVVIGLRAKDVSVEEAINHVAGYTIANDLSARDLGPRANVPPNSPFKFDWIGQKGFDGSCPLGPAIVPAEDIADPERLAIQLRVNRRLRQDSNTCHMLFGIADQISDLSHKCTLYPGDIILTGTPAGVGTATGEFLKPGDLVDVHIEGTRRTLQLCILTAQKRVDVPTPQPRCQKTSSSIAVSFPAC